MMVAVRRSEWARFVPRPCAILVFSLAVSAGLDWDLTPPAAAQSQPQCSGACFDVRLALATENPDGTTTLTWTVTNRCESQLGTVTFELPSGLAAVAPADGGVFVAANGREYLVDNPAAAPFHGIQFVLADGFDGASSGETETYVYVLPAGTFDATSTRFEGRAEQHVETLVVTPNGCCPIADAGPDQILECSAGSASTTLDASGSSDPDSDPLDFLWSIDDGAQLLAGAIVPVTLGFGSHDILLNANDATCTSTDTATATVVDSVAPSAPSCPSNVVTLGSETCAADLTATATASDTCAGPVSQSHTYSFSAPGVQSFTYSLADPSGNAAACTQTVAAVDVTAPSVSCPGGTVTLAPTTCTATTTLSAMADDACGGSESDSHTYSFSAPASQSFTYSFSDPSQNATTCTQTVIAVDATPPEVEVGTPSVTIFKPLHRCRAFDVMELCGVTASDACEGGWLATRIMRITADEEAAQDIQITGETTFSVRSERNPGGNGRVYNVHFDVIDAAGNSASESCKIEVPRAPVMGAIEDPEATNCTPEGDCRCS